MLIDQAKFLGGGEGGLPIFHPLLYETLPGRHRRKVAEHVDCFGTAVYCNKSYMLER